MQTKWHPGHYILGDAEQTTFPQIYGRPYFKGAKIAIPWRTLEPSKGVYDFSVVDKALANLKANGKRLVVMVQYKTFHQAALEGRCAPLDLINSNDVVFRNTDSTTPKCIAAMWRANVADRFIALTKAMGQRFDKDPNFEAVVFPETALGLGTDLEAQYTFSNDAYKVQLKRTMTAARAAFPATIIMQYGNWLSDDEAGMKELMEHARQVGIGFGGPDLVPGWYTSATKYFKDYAAKMPLGIDNQIGGPISAWIANGGTVDQAYQYAVNDPAGLHVNYVFWSKREDNTNNWGFSNSIAPTIDKYSGKINTGCPTNIKCTAP